MQMTNKDITVLAAKAAGIDGQWCDYLLAVRYPSRTLSGMLEQFDPLRMSSTALWLSGRLMLDIIHGKDYVRIRRSGVTFYQVHFLTESQREEAMRRAISCAAALIGKIPSPIPAYMAYAATPPRSTQQDTTSDATSDALWHVCVSLDQYGEELVGIRAACQEAAIAKVRGMRVEDYLALARIPRDTGADTAG